MLCSFGISTEASAPAVRSYYFLLLFRVNNEQCRNESSAGADVSVEVSKLHNIKLLSYYTSLNIFALINFAACRQNPESQGNSKSV